MYNRQHLKSYNISKLGVIVLSIVLLTGISIIPTLQIEVQGRGQPHRLTTPGTSPTPGTSLTSGRSPPPPTPGTSAAPSATPAPPTPGMTPPLSSATIRPPSDFGVVGEAVNQSAMVMIPQSSVMTMMSNLQAAMNAIDNDNKDEAIRALNSANQQLKSAANAAGMPVENMAG
jgi:hypothetical protein